MLDILIKIIHFDSNENDVLLWIVYYENDNKEIDGNSL